MGKPEIDIKDTIITDEMKDQIPEEDYIYYYVPPEIKPPQVAYRFQPDDDIKFFMAGAKDQERLIFPPDEVWEPEEEEKYEDFMDFLESKDEEKLCELPKHQVMRYLYGSHFKFKDTLKNIVENLEHLETVRPIILNDNMKELLEAGLMYMTGRDRHFRPLFFGRP